MEKTVLVHFGELARPVTVKAGEDLLPAIRERFKDIRLGRNITLQVLKISASYLANYMQLASATRQKKRECLCGTCGKNYYFNTNKDELWVGCDLCLKWYCSQCENLSAEPECEMYFCTHCR